MATATKLSKPPYRVPSMREIEALRPNGFKIVSTFSGCGGSCLGFRMAAFKTLWASEFIPAAQDTYRVNHPTTHLDTRDIRAVTPENIREVIGDIDLDVLEGSPPCASFSTAGKRSAGWGVVRKYSDSEQRTDDLFFEYARLLRGLKPKTFVAENVSGLVKGVAKGYFKQVLAELASCGYVVEAKVLDAQWLGVPQMRARLIFMGVREDLAKKFGVKPAFPKPFPYRYSVRDAIPWIESGVYDPRGNFDPQKFEGNEPVPTINCQENHFKVRARRGGQFKWQDKSIETPLPTVDTHEGNLLLRRTKAAKIRHADGFGAEKWIDASAGPYSTVGTDPSFGSNVNNNGGKIKTGDGETRRFTIPELKRICAFPDDFQLTGSYGQQWERLGRSVPPLMMKAVADILRDEVLSKCAE